MGARIFLSCSFSFYGSEGESHVRGAPSSVRKFITCSGCSMEGALPKKKERVPTVLGVAQFCNSVDVSDIFYFFLLGGGEGGAPKAPRRGRMISY